MPTTRTPTYRPHLLIQASGLIGPDGSAYERFSFGIRVGAPGSGPIAISVSDGDLPDYANDVKAFFGRAKTMISPSAVLTGIKVAEITADGSWAGAAPRYKEACHVPGGGSTGQFHPPQIALAVTLRTPQAGPRGRGRFYLPCPAMAVNQVSGLALPADAQTVRDSVVQFVKDLNDKPGVDGDDQVVIVASTFGATNRVVRADVGMAFDTIRSRRNELVEAYVPGPLA